MPYNQSSNGNNRMRNRQASENSNLEAISPMNQKEDKESHPCFKDKKTRKQIFIVIKKRHYLQRINNYTGFSHTVTSQLQTGVKRWQHKTLQVQYTHPRAVHMEKSCFKNESEKKTVPIKQKLRFYCTKSLLRELLKVSFGKKE